MYFLTKLLSEDIFAVALSSYHTLPYYGTIIYIWLILDSTLVDRWITWLLLLISVTNWGLLKRSIEDPLSIIMLFFRSSSKILFCYSLALISKPPTILINTCVNIIFSWMKFWVTVVHELNAEILYYSSLVYCDFLLPYCDSAFCE